MLEVSWDGGLIGVGLTVLLMDKHATISDIPDLLRIAEEPALEFPRLLSQALRARRGREGEGVLW